MHSSVKSHVIDGSSIFLGAAAATCLIVLMEEIILRIYEAVRSIFCPTSSQHFSKPLTNVNDDLPEFFVVLRHVDGPVMVWG